MNEQAAKSVSVAENLGLQQYNNFVKERLIEGKHSVFEPIHRNNIAPFQKGTTTKTRSTQKLSDLKNDRSLFTRLYIDCQSREGDLDDFFAHENSEYPPAISDAGLLRKGTKSDAVLCLQKNLQSKKEPNQPEEIPEATCLILDGAVIVHIIKPGISKTFSEYSSLKFQPYVMHMFSKFDRIDIIFDRYLENSLKQEE